MRKFLKTLLVVFFICVFGIGIFTYVFRNRINLYLNIAKNYLQIEEDMKSIEDLTCYTPLNSMDYKDIVYKNQNGVELTLDLFGPTKKLNGGSPVVLFVHGGSWIYGDKTIPKSISPLLESFRESGYTVISTSYEFLKEDINMDKPISDVKDTIRWVYKNKDIYNFNTDEIGILGFSAGAHLSLISAYSNKDEFIGDINLKDYPSNVKYVIDIFGPTDLSTLNINNANATIASELSELPNLNELEKKYSPINYVKEGVPETLIIHSKTDKLVPYENSTLLYNRLLKASVETKLVSLETSNHDLSNINVEELAPVALEVLKFVIKNSPL